MTARDREEKIWIDAERVGCNLCLRNGTGWSLTGKRLGKGATASVLEVNTPDGLRALKVLVPEFCKGPKGIEQRKRLQLQRKLIGHNCDSLVQLYECDEIEERLYVVMERANGKELAKLLDKVPEQKIAHILSEVTRAVEFLESVGLCHRDVKVDNIFVSDDFEKVTLLDVSVARDFDSVEGSGTDDGGLPVVATTRYCPPEYLFRLMPASEEQSRLLNLYQLGALLHDLIMRRPMFADEFEDAQKNRYRFAYFVATITPVISSTTAPPALCYLARRAIDKDAGRRATLTYSDFTDQTKLGRLYATEMLKAKSSVNAVNPSTGLRAKCKVLRNQIVTALVQQGIPAKHDRIPDKTLGRSSLQFVWIGEHSTYTWNIHVSQFDNPDEAAGLEIEWQLGSTACDPELSGRLPGTCTGQDCVFSMLDALGETHTEEET